jgi:hypothetical protein
MECDEYLRRSRLFRHLRSGPHGSQAVAACWPPDERMVELYLQHRAGKSIQLGGRSALKRWLSVLREEGAVAPAVLPPLTSHDRIFNEFDAYLRTERGLAPKSIVRHLPVVCRFVHEVAPPGDDDLGPIDEQLLHYGDCDAMV